MNRLLSPGPWVSVACLAGALLLNGCQTPPSIDAIDEQALGVIIEERETQLTGLTHFQVSGGLGIWTDEESLSARFNWLQADAQLQLALAGPLGLGDMNLLDDGETATLTRGNKLLATGHSAAAVLQQGLGFEAQIPLDQIAFWLRGLPGRANSVLRDGQGKLSSLRFTDETGTNWQARFRRYSDFEGLAVPSLITASGGRYSVRLLLKNWQNAAGSVVPRTNESNNRLPIPGR